LGSTEEAIYYAINGADEDGKYILLEEKFGTNDKTFRKKVRGVTGKRTTKQFYTMEAIEELYLKKCSTHTCISKKNGTSMKCYKCRGGKR
jgi:hypothetical protein